METFSSILQQNIGSGNFKFHPKCQDSGISHLISADLVIMCGADSESFELSREQYMSFTCFLVFSPIWVKFGFLCWVGWCYQGWSCYYYEKPWRQSFSQIFGGSPYISTRLSAADCDVLKDKILGRNKGWTNKSLTYGGRAQFTQSILFKRFGLPSLCCPREYWRILRGYFATILIVWFGIENFWCKTQTAASMCS